jgi:hypothetical protein
LIRRPAGILGPRRSVAPLRWDVNPALIGIALAEIAEIPDA